MGNLQSAQTTLKGVKEVLSSVISSPFRENAAPTPVQNVNNNAAAHNCPVRVPKRQRYKVNGDGSLVSNNIRLHARTTSSSSASDRASAFKLTSTPTKNSLGKSNLTAFDNWSPTAGKKISLIVLGAAFSSNPLSAEGCSTEFPSSSDSFSAEVVVTITFATFLWYHHATRNYHISSNLTQICTGLGFGCHFKIGNFKKGNIFYDCHTVINANNNNNTTMKLFLYVFSGSAAH
jgi:hypothetical protein